MLPYICSSFFLALTKEGLRKFSAFSNTGIVVAAACSFGFIKSDIDSVTEPTFKELVQSEKGHCKLDIQTSL